MYRNYLIFHVLSRKDTVHITYQFSLNSHMKNAYACIFCASYAHENSKINK